MSVMSSRHTRQPNAWRSRATSTSTPEFGNSAYRNAKGRRASGLSMGYAIRNSTKTAEGQKTYDEIMAKGRSVADAVKQHRHDREVFGFTRELSDNVIGGLDGGDLDRQAALPSPGRLSLRQQPGNRRCPPR